MKTNNVLSFTLAGTRPSFTASALPHADLLTLPATAALITDTALLLGENVLLPATTHPRFRYACSAYLISQDGRKALPVVCCRGWFHAPLPTQAPGHPVWADLRGGLLAAAERLASSPYDLNGAVTAARSWMRYQEAGRYERRGCEVLLGGNASLYCDEQPDAPPPQAARVVTMPTRTVRQVPQTVRLLAA